MCNYEACLCGRAVKRCHSTHKNNYLQPVEWTGTCHLRPGEEFKKAWTLRDFPPEWWCRQEKVLVDSKPIRYAQPCADCKTVSKEKRKNKMETKEKENGMLKGEESGKEGAPMELKRRYTIGAVARQSLVLSRLRKLKKMRATADEVQASLMRAQGKAWV